MVFLYKKKLAPSALAYIKLTLKSWLVSSGLLWSTNLVWSRIGLGSGRKSYEIMDKMGILKLIGQPSHCSIRAAPSGKWSRVIWDGCTFKNKCDGEVAMIFFRVLFSGIGGPDYQIKISYIIFFYISGPISYISPIFQVESPIFLLYFRSESPIFSYISGPNLLYFHPSPIFFGSLVAWHPVNIL